MEAFHSGPKHGAYGVCMRCFGAAAGYWLGWVLAHPVTVLVCSLTQLQQHGHPACRPACRPTHLPALPHSRLQVRPARLLQVLVRGGASICCGGASLEGVPACLAVPTCGLACAMMWGLLRSLALTLSCPPASPASQALRGKVRAAQGGREGFLIAREGCGCRAVGLERVAGTRCAYSQFPLLTPACRASA